MTRSRVVRLTSREEQSVCYLAGPAFEEAILNLLGVTL